MEAINSPGIIIAIIAMPILIVGVYLGLKMYFKGVCEALLIAEYEKLINDLNLTEDE